MSLLWRKIKRSNKKAAKYRYSISCKELLIDCAQKWRPESIVVAWMHRKRRYTIDPRRLEWSFDSPTRAMVLWPEGAQDPLFITTTLFRDQEQDQFEDKEWTLVIEEITAKGKHRPLAAISINLRLFITDLPGTRMEAKFKLRPLRKEVLFCTVQFDISSKLLKESDVFADSDRHSLASAISIPEDKIAVNDSIDIRQQIENFPIETTDKFVNDVKEISNEIKNFNKVSSPVKVDANQSTSSVSAVPQFTYDYTKMFEETPNFNTNYKTETDHAIPSTTPRSSLPGDTSPKLSRKRYTSGQKADETNNESHAIDLSHSDQVKSLVDDIKALRFTKPPGKVDEDDANKRSEDLRQRARKILQNPEAAVIESNIDEERRKQLQEELRKLKANTHSSTPPVDSSIISPMQPLRKTSSTRSIGSNSDLRTLDVITTQTNFRTFKKREPSPQLQRKNYDSPIIQAYGRPSMQTNGSADRLNHGTLPSTSTPVSAFDRMKRFGSLRGQELAESLAQFVSPGIELVDRRQQVTIRTNQHPTPTRKLMSRLEKDLRNSTDPSIEIQKIGERIEEIGKLSAEIGQKMQNVESGSVEEEDLLTTHIELTNEKDALVRRQDYFNVLADLNETREKAALVRNMIASSDGFAKTQADKTQADNLMSQLKDLVDREDELTQELDKKIEDEDDEKERSRQTLERTKNFNRAPQDPLSASKRFFTNVFRP